MVGFEEKTASINHLTGGVEVRSGMLMRIGEDKFYNGVSDLFIK